MADLFAPVCSIAPTRRRRFTWAAWWSEPPARDPFRQPDASGGGARSRAEALAAAEKAAGRPLVLVDARWARAWSRVLVGEPPWTLADAAHAAADGASATPRPPRAGPARRPENLSIWAILGVTPHATLEEIKLAFRQRALATHPDHGGDALAFRTLRAAYDEACKRREKAAPRPRRRR